MMTMNRRQFVIGSAAAVAATVVALPALAETIPIKTPKYHTVLAASGLGVGETIEVHFGANADANGLYRVTSVNTPGMVTVEKVIVNNIWGLPMSEETIRNSKESYRFAIANGRNIKNPWTGPVWE